MGFLGFEGRRCHCVGSAITLTYWSASSPRPASEEVDPKRQISVSAADVIEVTGRCSVESDRHGSGQTLVQSSIKQRSLRLRPLHGVYTERFQNGGMHRQDEPVTVSAVTARPARSSVRVGRSQAWKMYVARCLQSVTQTPPCTPKLLCHFETCTAERASWPAGTAIVHAAPQATPAVFPGNFMLSHPFRIQRFRIQFRPCLNRLDGQSLRTTLDPACRLYDQ